MRIHIKRPADQFAEIENGESAYSILKKYFGNYCDKYLAVKVNNEVQELGFTNFKEGDSVEFLDIKDKYGQKIYVRTLSLIYIKACRDLFKEDDVSIEHSLNKGLYSEIKGRHITKGDIQKIKKRMQELIDSKMPIVEHILKTEEAISIFKGQNMPEKVELLKGWEQDTIRVYELEGYFDTFYGYVAPNTGAIDKFDLRQFSIGIVLNYPLKESNYELPDYIEQKKLSKVFYEAEEWARIMDIGTVGALNSIIEKNSISDLVRINEALHEKKIAYIADEIASDQDIRVVLIAGPSSSGKTTFAQRLSIQLRVNGIKTYALSLDDYFVDREHTPKDENGEYDFETIDALDLKLFNSQLLKLMSSEPVEIPTYNFMKGTREYKREPVTLSRDHVIIIEGLHGLNDALTYDIPKKNKFKIYISALTQLNLDNHNNVATSDLRLIRRIVRDNTYRGSDVMKTIEQWDSVVKGTEKYIFPFQENADVMFNSSLVYELGALKKHAFPLIEKIDDKSELSTEKKRLLNFLGYFRSIDDESIIPNTSILREFIGGSCFS